jgi:hypothetical protein
MRGDHPRREVWRKAQGALGRIRAAWWHAIRAHMGGVGGQRSLRWIAGM